MRRVRNNPSGKYLLMTDEQMARENAAFQRAVERQRQKDAAKAASQTARQCPVCLKWFMTKVQRDAHITKRHTGEEIK